MKHICKRDFMRNGYKALSGEPTIVTNNGQPQYFVGSIGTIRDLSETIDNLQAFQSAVNNSLTANKADAQTLSLGHIHTHGTSENGVTASDLKGFSSFTVKPIVKGGIIKYEKHSHK